MTTISIRLNKEEEAIFQSYAELMGKPLSDLFKAALAEQIEDFFDLQEGEEILKNLSGETVSLKSMLEAEGIS